MKLELNYLDSFLLYKKNVCKIRESSLNTYKNIIIRFIKYFNNDRNITNEYELYNSLSRLDMEKFINNNINNNVSENYINLFIITIKDFMNYLFENEIIKNNVFAKVKQIKNPETKKKDYITIEDTKMIIQESYNKKRGDRNFELVSHRLRALIGVLISGGCRISEALNLTINDLQLVNDCYLITYTADKIKNHMSKKIVISNTAKRYLDEYIEIKNKLFPESKYLFISNKGKQFTAKNSIESLQKAINKCGINKHICNHSFRSTFKMICMNRNISDQVVKAIAGWSLSKVEKSYYQELSFDTVKNVCDIL